MKRASMRGALFGLGAAASFGISAPISKLLLREVQPVLLAGLLYGGAALGLWGHRLLARRSTEARLTRDDASTLVAMVTAGGVVAPVLMLLGLGRVSALSGSLLLNLEAPLTVLLALLFFREHLGRAGVFSVLCVFSGAAMLGVGTGTLEVDLLGVLLLAGACLCWALDNNLTQRLSLKDPFAIVRIKTLAAGLVNVSIGLVIARGQLPSAGVITGALLLGAVSYGVSVVLDAYALREVGAAREAAYFATAPFVGALVSVTVLGDSLHWQDGAAMGLMVLGVVFLLRERHGHRHTHSALEHEHQHVHDAHHQHSHPPGVDPNQPHSHAHAHEALSHEHVHVSDLHHRHRH